MFIFLVFPSSIKIASNHLIKTSVLLHIDNMRRENVSLLKPLAFSSGKTTTNKYKQISFYSHHINIRGRERANTPDYYIKILFYATLHSVCLFSRHLCMMMLTHNNNNEICENVLGWIFAFKSLLRHATKNNCLEFLWANLLKIRYLRCLYYRNGIF